MTRLTPNAVNAIAYEKGSELYMILYPDEKRREALLQVGHWACNSELSFNWYDAAHMSGRIRKEARAIQES